MNETPLSNHDTAKGGLTELAIRNQVTVLVVVGLLCFAGLSSYFSMPKQQDPGFTIRNTVISTPFPGANPKRVEQLVTDQIEEVLQEIPEIDYITSESRSGISIVTVTFQEKYKNMRPLFNKVRRKMDDLKDSHSLPSGALTPHVNDEYGDVFGILYVLKGEGYNLAELKEIADEIKNDLLGIDNVAKVDISGEQDEMIYVEYNGARLQQTGLSPFAIQAALQGANILEGGGNIRYGQERIILEPTGNFETVEALRKTVIQLPNNGGVAYLGDLADISRGYVDPAESIIHHNGGPALLIAISLQEGGDILALNDVLDATVPGIEASYPYGISMKKVYSQPELVQKSIDDFTVNLLQAIVIVAVVMFLFLGFRTGLIVASLIPTTILASFVIMSYLGITVNQVSLAALIIALGLLVDNAIVMAETIMKRREQGEDKVRAAIMVGKEMSTPLLISSLTTCAAFLSIFLAESAVGEYTADIFKVVSIALLSSWLLAMTFIPLMTLMLMKVKPPKAQKEGQSTPYQGLLYRVYRRLLFPSLRYKLVAVGAALGLFVLAIWALQFVPKVFIPERTDPIINAKFNMPRGTDIAVTEVVMSDLERYMMENHVAQFSQEQNREHEVIKEGILDIIGFIGVGTPRFSLTINPDQENSHIGAMIVSLSSLEALTGIVTDVKQYAFKKYPDLEVKMRKMENGTPIDYPIEIRVSGNDIDTLYELIGAIKSQLLATPGVLSVSDDWGVRTKKLTINISQERARRAGVSNADVALSLSTGLSGLKMTEFREGDDLIPVELRSVSADRQDLNKLDGVTIYAQGSQVSVPLKQVADVELAFENGIIKRRDIKRTITVRTQHFPGVTATEVLQEIEPWLLENSVSWPAGYSYEMGGEMETSSDANEAIAAKLPISGALILLLLLVQFNSLRKTAIILFTIPLGLIGITFGLIVAKSIFGFFTILGLVSLAGIVINNAIVLIDRINIEREENGREAGDAVIEACQQRLRPIILTTCTTVGGMLPLWISHDPMFETMAVSIIFGLLFATLLTLILVPVLYSLFFRVKYKALKYHPTKVA